MLTGKKNELTMRVLKQLRSQGAPKKVGLISEMGPEEDMAPEETLEPIVESKSGLLPKKKRQKFPSKA